MIEKGHSAVGKFARDAVLTIVGGLVLEPTLKRIHFDVGPYLPQIWLGIAMFLTLDCITRSRGISGKLIVWKKSLTWGKTAMSYLIVGIICGVVGCGYWAVLGTVIGKEPRKITKTSTFATLIPIVPARPNFPIPMNTNNLNPHRDYYQDLTGLTARPDTPPIDSPPYVSRNLEKDNGLSFAMNLVQYYTFQSIYRLQRGSSGIKWTAEVGVTPIQRTPIPPPDSVPYSNDAVLKMLSTSEFFRPTDKLMWRYDTNRLVVPKNTLVSFTSTPSAPEKGQMGVCGISFERPGYYLLTFDISSGFAAMSGMPPNFEPKQIAGTFTWSIVVTMHYEIARREDGDFEPEAYEAWANALFDGLRSKMEIN